jgi:hypothetical protein
VRRLDALPQVDTQHLLWGAGQMLQKQTRESPAVYVRRGICLPGGVAHRERVMRLALAGSVSVSWQSGVLLMKWGTAGTGASFICFFCGG